MHECIVFEDTCPFEVGSIVSNAERSVGGVHQAYSLDSQAAYISAEVGSAWNIAKQAMHLRSLLKNHPRSAEMTNST